MRAFELDDRQGVVDARVEMRLYVTHAKWSGVNGAVVTGERAFDGKESGTSYGAQVEIWF